MEKELFELMTKLYNKVESMETEMQDGFKRIDNEMQKMNSKITNLEEGQAKIRHDIVRLENKMDNKLSALFDAREVGIDKETEISTGLQRVESKVDKLELKVLRNNLHLPSINGQ